MRQVFRRHFIALAFFSLLTCSAMSVAFAADASSEPDLCQVSLWGSGIERVQGERIRVGRLTSTKAIPLVQAFPDGVGILIGVDTSRDRQPYLIIGGSEFRVTSTYNDLRPGGIYGEVMVTGIPAVEMVTIHQLGVVPAVFIKPGYFIRLGGFSIDELNQMRERLIHSIETKFETTNENPRAIIKNLTHHLSFVGLRLACKDIKCQYAADLFNKALRHGFRTSTRAHITPEFYTANYASLAQGVRIENRSMAYERYGDIGAMLMVLGVSAAAFYSLFTLVLP